MTKIKFLLDGDSVLGFSVSGHSSRNCTDTSGKIVCSAVSSAVYMAANTLTEIIGQDCEINIDDALFTLKTSAVNEGSQAVLKGLKLHLTELSKEYPQRIKIISEV